MHELGIAQNIVEIVQKEIASQDVKRVITVNLDIGVMTAVVPSALEFGFEVATQQQAPYQTGSNQLSEKMLKKAGKM